MRTEHFAQNPCSPRSRPLQARLRFEAAALEPSDLPLTPATRNVTALRGKPDEIVIPQYDVRAAMGHGQVPSDYNQAIRNIIVSADLLQEKGVTYTQPTSLAIVTGWGQSMEGTINDKDPVIVDRGAPSTWVKGYTW